MVLPGRVPGCKSSNIHLFPKTLIVGSCTSKQQVWQQWVLWATPPSPLFFSGSGEPHEWFVLLRQNNSTALLKVQTNQKKRRHRKENIYTYPIIYPVHAIISHKYVENTQQYLLTCKLHIVTCTKHGQQGGTMRRVEMREWGSAVHTWNIEWALKSNHVCSLSWTPFAKGSQGVIPLQKALNKTEVSGYQSIGVWLLSTITCIEKRSIKHSPD